MSRDLDYQIAALLGDRLVKRGKWKGYWTAGKGRHWSHEDDGPEHFSTDISAAWRVVEAMEQKGWFVEVGLCNAEYGPKKRAWCQIGEYGSDGAYVAEAYEDAAPMAICLAALKAVEEGTQ